MNKSSSGPLFTPAKTQRASEAIYNQIYPKIVSGELKPGDRLPPERELAEMFQRSRPVVREALRMLQQDGLLETSVGSAGGAVIRGISLWGDRIFEKCGIRRDEGGDGGKTLEIRGKRRLSARDGGANYQQS